MPFNTGHLGDRQYKERRDQPQFLPHLETPEFLNIHAAICFCAENLWAEVVSSMAAVLVHFSITTGRSTRQTELLRMCRIVAFFCSPSQTVLGDLTPKVLPFLTFTDTFKGPKQKAPRLQHSLIRPDSVNWLERNCLRMWMCSLRKGVFISSLRMRFGSVSSKWMIVTSAVPVCFFVCICTLNFWRQKKITCISVVFCQLVHNTAHKTTLGDEALVTKSV